MSQKVITHFLAMKTGDKQLMIESEGNSWKWRKGPFMKYKKEDMSLGTQLRNGSL